MRVMPDWLRPLKRFIANPEMMRPAPVRNSDAGSGTAVGGAAENVRFRPFSPPCVVKSANCVTLNPASQFWHPLTYEVVSALKVATALHFTSMAFPATRSDAKTFQRLYPA